MELAKRYKWQLLLVPFLITGGLILFCLIHYGVNTPFWDEWEMVAIFQDKDHHQLTFSDFWRQHNEHRIFFPNIVLTIGAYLTHWNVKAELLYNFFFSVITALMLYLFILKKIKTPLLMLFAGVLIAAWYFSPVQYENWLWGWQVEWFMCVAGAVVTIFLLDLYSGNKYKRGWLLLTGAIITAVIATFSLGSGILIWPVGFAILLLYRQSKKPIGIWIIAALVSAAAYYHNYHKPAGDPSTTLFLHQRLNFIRYILSYFGRPVSDQQDVAMLMGAILLALLIPVIYMVWLKRAQLPKFMPWLSLMTLSLLAGGLTAVSRLGFGVIQGSASRYTAFSLLYVIGLTGLICTLFDTVKMRKSSLAIVILVSVAINGPLLFSSYSNGRAGFRQLASKYEAIAACTHMPSPADSCLLLTYPHADVTRPRLEYLKSKHWAGY